MEAGDSCLEARCLEGQGHLGSCVTLSRFLNPLALHLLGL